MKTNYKRIPFDLDKAKRITKGEMKGRIVTQDGRQARFICLDEGYTYPMNILIENEENSRFYCRNGSYLGSNENPLSLHLEVPNNENRLSNKNKQMTRTTYKKIPFDIELAKKIMNKEMKGRIVTRNGRQVRIICFDLKNPVWGIIALVLNNINSEDVLEYQNNGCYSTNIGGHELDLLLEVPTYYRDYSNFKPCKWQPCLVRDTASDLWRMGVCCGTDSYEVPIFYSANNSDGCCHWGHFLPLSKVTERLFGTKKSYEELIQELDNEQGKD